MTRRPRKDRSPRKDDGEADRVLPAIPIEAKWVLMLIMIMFMPQKTNWFEFATRPEQAYAELRLGLPGRVIVIGKNAGSRRIALLAKSFEMHTCKLIRGKNAFAAHVPGIIPPASYSVAIFTTSPADDPSARVRLDDDSEFEPEQLRITTPIEEDQYIFAAVVVMLLTAAVSVRLRDYYREDNDAMTGRRS